MKFIVKRNEELVVLLERPDPALACYPNWDWKSTWE